MRWLTPAARPPHQGARRPRAGYAVAPSRRARRSGPRRRLRRRRLGRRSKGSRGRKCARRPPVRSARSPHGSGRSAPSRVASPSGLRPRPWWAFPLDCAPVARCARERLAERTAARGRPYQLSSIQLMPICTLCPHSGLHHDWTSPPCSATECACQRRHPRRLRGRCLVSGCGCPKYVPRTDLPEPLSPYIGKARRWRG